MLKANIVSVSVAGLQRLQMKDVSVEFIDIFSLEELLALMEPLGFCHVKAKFTAPNKEGEIDTEEKDIKVMGREYDKYIQIRAAHGAIGGYLHTDIKIPE